MPLSNQTQAILLLTSYFSKPVKDEVKPLTPSEWGRFAKWLHEQSLQPETLLHINIDKTLENWSDKTITFARIKQLLNRGAAMALAIEKWLRAGLWILTRSDEDYPERLKKRLKFTSPPIIFGCGNRKLLNQGGVAIVGSRNVNDADLDDSKLLASNAANQGFSIISGAAKGIDETAMLAALNVNGTAIGITADSLLRHALSAKYKKALMQNNLVLISPFYPEAGFNVGNAMARNKYIYCLADTAIVIHSGLTGGTWNGAIENMKKNWVSLWVKTTEDKKAGNFQLVEKGGTWLGESLANIQFNILAKPSVSNGLIENIIKEEKISQDIKSDSLQSEQKIKAQIPLINFSTEDLSFYDFFLYKINKLTIDEAKTTDDLIEELNIAKGQLNSWLKLAVEESKIKKLTKPVRYQSLSTNKGSSLFL